MASTLEFDVEKLRSTKETCEGLIRDLRSAQSKLQTSLDQLRRDWNTAAGKEFFKNQDKDWSEQVDHYIDIANAVVSLLECAIKEYAEIEAKAQSLNFDP